MRKITHNRMARGTGTKVNKMLFLSVDFIFFRHDSG